MLILVHFLFKFEAVVYWLEAEWSAGDILAFIGTILSFIGTLILGCVTVKLSQDNNNINTRLVEIETKRESFEKDKRLGYIISEKMEIRYYENVEEKISDSERAAYTITDYECRENTNCIHFILGFRMTSESIINVLDCVSVKIYELGFNDNWQDMTSTLCWIPIYKREEKFTRNINQMNKTFEEIIILAEYDRNPIFFRELHRIMLHKAQYMISLEFLYCNTLQEKRKEILQITCMGNQIIRNEIVSIA